MPDVYGYWLSTGESPFNEIFVSAFLFLGIQSFFETLLVIVLLRFCALALFQFTCQFSKKRTHQGFLNNQQKKSFKFFTIFFLHSAEKAQKPEPLIHQADWCSAFIKIARSELKYHQWYQKTVTWFLGMHEVHSLDGPCMCSASHIIQPLIYEKKKKAHCLFIRTKSCCSMESSKGDPWIYIH